LSRTQPKDSEHTGDEENDTLTKQLSSLKLENSKLSQRTSEQIELLVEFEEQINELNRQVQILRSQVSSEQYQNARKIASVVNVLVPKGRFGRRVRKVPVAAYEKMKKMRDTKTLNQRVQALKGSNFFDTEYYLSRNPDVRRSGMDPAEHYLRYGSHEGRSPSTLFDQEFYLARYADVRNGQVNPLLHFIYNGKNEGRAPTLLTDEDLHDVRIPIVFQLESFDKGGLEEVVLMLSSDEELAKKYKVYVFVVGEGGGYLSELARGRGVRVIDLNHDTVFLNYLIKKLNIKVCNLHYSIFGINTYRASRVKLIYTIHNNYIWADEGFVTVRSKEYGKIDSFIAVSDQVGDFFSQKFHIARNKITTVTNGVNIHNVEDIIPQRRSDYGIKPNDFVFISVASFTSNKFHAVMIAALASAIKENPRAKLLLVGNVLDNEYYSIIQKLITKYKVKNNVIIVDYVPKSQVLGLLDMSDCFIQVSLTEGFSISSLEAMYYNLPMILSDVGGARHVINKSDLGIIVKNPYDDIQELTDSKIKQFYMSDSNLENLQDVSSAMITMIKEQKSWRQRSQKGRSKVEKYFQSGSVVKGYDSSFTRTIHEQTDFLDDIMHTISEAKIAFVAPFPTRQRINEGWMSRIRVVDSVIGARAKVYVNFLPGNEAPAIKLYEDKGWELQVGIKSVYYAEIISSLVNVVDTVYVHTLHLAEYVIPWLDSDKIVVDFHGITPEEEVMLGRSFLKDKYEDIEQRVLQGAKTCVMVTGAMREHYAQKYPRLKPKRVIILPIVEDIQVPINQNPKKFASKKFNVIYSGGNQSWQNIEDMLQLTKDCQNFTDVTFLSREWREMQTQGQELGLPETTQYEYCPKEKLCSKYQEYEFGLVLRDDIAVNRVACPTKLYEYTMCGLIPIVRSEQMGDFVAYGYRYIREQDFILKKIPERKELVKMVEENAKAADKLKQAFRAGSNNLKELVGS
jgi:glycosyltransferase involved in cell wall biosynthesis